LDEGVGAGGAKREYPIMIKTDKTRKRTAFRSINYVTLR
jgi:hypothetical protein